VSSWRTALRVAWREAKRAKGRSALVIAMITLPVMAMVFVVVNFDTFELSATEKADRLMGSGQAAVTWTVDGGVQQLPDYLTSYPVGESAGKSATPTDQQLLAQFPAGTQAIRDAQSSLAVRTADGIGTLPARMLDYTDPLAQGILRPLSGRAPSAPNEIALTPGASARLGVGLDGTVTAADGTDSFKVTGTVEDPSDLDATAIVLRPGRLPVQRQDLKWLVRTPDALTWAEVKQLNTHGIAAVSRQVLATPPDSSELYENGVFRSGQQMQSVFLVGGLAALEVVLLAGAAFAVGARRRRRDLALVAASGGTPGHIRRIVLADGIVHGLIAAVIGVALGLAGAALTVPLIENTLMRQRAGELLISVPTLGILAALAVLTGLLAALVPAWVSSRQDVVTALAGRRGITRTSRRWVVIGLVSVGVGVVIAIIGASQSDEGFVLFGLAVTELAIVMCTPALVGLVARTGRWLPLAARIALRDASRNRTAAAPAISAVMAAVIGSLLVAFVMGSGQERDRLITSMQVGQVFVLTDMNAGSGPVPQVESALRETIPYDRIHKIEGVSCGGQDCAPVARATGDRACPYAGYLLNRPPSAEEQKAAVTDPRCKDIREESQYFGTLSIGGAGMGLTAVIDPSAAGAVSDIPAEDLDAVTAALRDGKVVVDNPNAMDNGNVTLTLQKFGRQDAQPQTLTAPAFAMPHRPRADIIMMTPSTARKLGFDVTPLGTLATTTRMPTVAESDRLQASVGNSVPVYVERGPGSDDQTLVILAIVAGVITLGAAALATGLAAADGRADLSTLAAVGASPRLRRTLSLSQSGVIAGLGSILGGIAGVGAAAAVLAGLNQSYAGTWPTPVAYPLAMPWLNIVITVVAVPLVAMLGAGLLTRSRLPIENRL
jgi:putative ABC transport system permease protein